MANKFHTQGMEAFQRGDYAQSIPLFLQAIQANPELAESHLFLGKAYFFCDNKTAAIEPLKAYTELNKANKAEIANVSYAFDILGQCYEAIDQAEKASICYKAATDINPMAASAWHNWGVFCTNLAEYHLNNKLLSESIRHFHAGLVFLKRALGICTTMPNFLHSLASWHEKYVQVLEQIAEQEFVNQQKIKTNYKLAIGYYEKSLAVCKEDDNALKNIINTNLGECLAQYGHFFYKNQDYAKAQKYYLLTLKQTPHHWVAISQMGMTFVKQNQLVAAREYFSRLVSNTTEAEELADAWLNIAYTYRLDKEWILAEHALLQAKTLAPNDEAILAEEQQLRELKAQASLIAAGQPMFNDRVSVLKTSLGEDLGMQLKC